MKDRRELILRFIVVTGAAVSSARVLLVFFYILRESLLFFRTVTFTEFLFGSAWSPLSPKPEYSFLPMILATMYISLLATAIAAPLSAGCALFLAFNSHKKVSKFILLLIDMIAGIPSVIFGFIGLVVLVKFLERHLNMTAGESVLAGSILLSVMLFPYMVTGYAEAFENGKAKYYAASQSLGVSKWYTMRKIILPCASNAVFINMLLAFSRAIGETMAVMMVTGNSPIFPKLLGRAETIPSLIALEMGTAEYKSVHYSSLYAAGLILIITVFFIQLAANRLNNTGRRNTP